MAKSPEEQLQSMIDSLPEKTGKGVEDWVALGKTSGAAKHGELLKWFKSEHGLTHGYANLLANRTLSSDSGSRLAAGDDLVSEMFAGDRGGLRPIFDALLPQILAFGDDIEQAPKKGYLSLRRRVQFATLHPSTKTRFDVGLKLKDAVPQGRLQAAGSWNGMVSHRVRLDSVEQVDPELVAWLRQAYESA